MVIAGLNCDALLLATMIMPPRVRATERAENIMPFELLF